MKILYSDFKKYIPALKVSFKELSETLTMLGHLLDSSEEVRYKGEKDYLIDVETRHNRADLLSILGLCREITSYYNLELKKPVINNMVYEGKILNIKVETEEAVKRVLAVQINDVKVQGSPKWLSEYLQLHGINSINNIIDISNYVMLLIGQPSHIFDSDKIKGTLSWKFSDCREITTLDNTQLKLDKSILAIEDEKGVLGLAGIIGAKNGSVSKDTKNILVETAVYDPVLVRKNAQQLTTRTEASIRLEKELDPNNLKNVIDLLVTKIIKLAGGKISSKLYEETNVSLKKKPIKLYYKEIRRYAGVDISKSKIESIIKSIDCNVKEKSKEFLVFNPPIGRSDLESQVDILEEVVRKYGFYRIPIDEHPSLKPAEDITTPYITLQEKVRNYMVANGFDEVITWPLVNKKYNTLGHYRNWKVIYTENSVNESVPELRTSISSGLIKLHNKYQRMAVQDVNIFETGVVFGSLNNKYQESVSLGILSANSSSMCSLWELNKVVQSLLNSLGIKSLTYIKVKKARIPTFANEHSCHTINIGNKTIGIIYKATSDRKSNIYLTELDLIQILKLETKSEDPVVQLKGKLTWIDKNIEVDKDNSDVIMRNELKEYKGKPGVFTVKVIDRYEFDEKVRYTIRVGYARKPIK